MFEFNQLRSFVAVATELNFRRAAELLHITQPPLSRQIQLLERELGVLLFDRSGRNIRLTAAGQRLLIEAQDLLQRAEGIASAARRAEAGDAGTVTLGFIPIAALALVPEIIALLRAELPNVELALREMLTNEQTESLPSGLIDLGIMRMPRESGHLNLVRIRQERYVLAMHKEHPLAAKAEVVLEDLHEQEFMMYSPSVNWFGYEVFNGLFIARGVKPKFVQSFGQSLAMISMVNSGVGLAFVPESAKVLGFDKVVLRDVQLPPHAAADHYLAWPRSSNDQPAARRARECLLRAFEVK